MTWMLCSQINALAISFPLIIFISHSYVTHFGWGFMKNLMALIFGLLFLLVISCTEEIVVPELQEKTAKISGYVTNGLELEAVIYLIDSTVVDSLEITSENGYYEFSNVKFGSYIMKVISRNSFKKNSISIFVNSTSETINNILLNEFPIEIEYIFPQPKDTISNNPESFEDSLLVVNLITGYYSLEFEMYNIESKIVIDSGMTFTVSSNPNGSYDTLKVKIPKSQVFARDSFSLYFDSTINTSFGDIEHEFYLKYYVDSSGYVIDTTDNGDIDSTIIDQTVPEDTSTTIDFMSSAYRIYFNSVVNKGEIEKGLSINPIIPYSVRWNHSQTASVLYLEADQYVQTNKVYTITIDSGTIIDSNTILDKDLTLLLKTPSLKVSTVYPLYGQIDIPTDTSLYVSFNQPILESKLDSNISITPSVGGMRIGLYSSYSNTYYITFDSSFVSNTIYTLKVDKGISDLFGNTMPDSTVITFTTGE